MPNTVSERFHGPSHQLADALITNQLVTNSVSTTKAIHKLDLLLQRNGYSLLHFGSYDTSAQLPANILFNKFPENVESQRQTFDSRLGCPVIRMAMKTADSFEALSADYSALSNVHTNSYIQKLADMGYSEIGVIPVYSNKLLHIIFVGLTGKYFCANIHTELMTVFQHFITAALYKFSDLGFHNNLSRTTEKFEPSAPVTKNEIECIFWTASGKTSSEISKILGLSEHTVNHYISSVCKKINATNRSHAVVKALKLGYFDLATIR